MKSSDIALQIPQAYHNLTPAPRANNNKGYETIIIHSERGAAW